MPSLAAAILSHGQDAFARAGFVEITPAMGVSIDVRYASSRNFLGRNLYGGFDRFYLHSLAAEKLRRGIARLAAEWPDRRLLLLDGLRPNRVQRQMWNAVTGTDKQIYVGDPAIGSIHGYGFAVDVSLEDEAGRELDMGTSFDDFRPLSEPRREAEFLRQGLLSAAQVGNRALLRAVMVGAGFHALPVEWWHFDALPPAEVRARYQLID